jgi:chromosomal replication initiation ATPase DnaA
VASSWSIRAHRGCRNAIRAPAPGRGHAAVALARCDRLDLRHLDAELTRISVAECAPIGLADRATLEAIARHFDVTPADIVGRSRKPAITSARAAAAAVLKERGRSFVEIGACLGNRDRSTVTQLAARGDQLLAGDASLRQQLAS